MNNGYEESLFYFLIADEKSYKKKHIIDVKEVVLWNYGKFYFGQS